MTDLTARQADLLRYLKEFIQANGYAPSVREICSAMGVKSTNGVIEHLKELQRKGRIWRAPGRGRALRIVEVG
jgi:repressor LexA